MPSIRSRVTRRALKLSLLLKEPITPENLEKKRIVYSRLSRRFPVPRGTKITHVTRNGFTAEWIDTPGSRQGVAILYVHGGGFVLNSTALHRELIARIARAGQARALSLDYSLAPEHPYPAAINEALAAYKWLLKQFPPDKLVLAGDSAGGSVALSLLHAIRENHLPNPACAVVLSPATDAYKVKKAIRENDDKDFFIKARSLEFFIDAYFQDTPRNHPIASPYYGPLGGFPPLLIHSDKDELLTIGVRKFVEKARREGVDISYYEATGLWHVWHLFARFVPEAKIAIKQIGDFIQLHTSSSNAAP